MRWKDLRKSTNVDDRRGAGGMRGPGRIILPGGRGGRTAGMGGIGLIVILLIALFLGIDPSMILSPGGVTAPEQRAPDTTEQAELKEFVAAVLGDTEDTWNALFQADGYDYREPRLVLFSGAVDSACGFADAAVGPFYCPPDQQVYLDMTFFTDMERRLGASGDFAAAYVIAHEVGHHVQNLLGIMDRVNQIRGGLGRDKANALSVMVELQADCFAGIWASRAQRQRNILEPGDIEEGLNAAAAVGDDRLQRRSQGYVVPESFTHGSSEQRVAWFTRGFETGNPDACDTFNADRL
ncbi:MAG TPA: neutral zinc metallopeptidase [Alphaproteobacteria bacterium]|nr:neutral zinc metallopeptidase [Alphaproteobacteria bacterium]